MKVSVIICNYNYGQFLREAVDSALAQTHPADEVLVVDDGSTDGSREVLRHYGDRIRLLFQENRGVSAARNTGIANSGGELIAFLDSDDAWLPTKLERQVEWFEDPTVGMVYTGLRYVDENGDSLGTSPTGSRGHVLEDLALLRVPGVPASGSSAVVRRSCLETVGPFDESLSTSADWDLWRRIACRYTIELTPEPLVLYRQHGSAMHRNVEGFEHDMLRAFEAMFEDDAAREVHPLKRRCYGRLYLTFAGSYLHARGIRKSLHYLWAGLSSWPGGVAYVVAMPFRWLRRRFGVGMLPQDVGRTPRSGQAT